MDLEILEALALSGDRSAALGQLLPGSEDHDYYTCLRAQHARDLDAAQAILDAWTGRHGTTDRFERMRLRQLLLRLSADPASVSDEVRDHFGVEHWHERDVDEVDPSRATRLPDGLFSGADLLRQAIDQSSDLSCVTDDGIEELLRRPEVTRLDTSRRRALLQRLRHSAVPALVELVVADLEANNQLGNLRVHGELTLEQLHQLAQRLPRLAGDARWVEAIVRRMRPPMTVDLDLDLDARARHAEALWTFAAPLTAAHNSLKAHILWHVLDGARRRDSAPTREHVETYLALPRSASYVPRRLTENLRSSEIAQLGTDYRSSTGLAPAGSDEELVRWLIQRDPAGALAYEHVIETSWLRAEIATAQLLRGENQAAATAVLGASRAAEVRERIEILWCAHNKTRFGTDEPIVLEADIKHVPELVVNVFRIDPLAYFQNNRREVNTDIDLDGLAASHEQTLTFSEPPVRRVRRRFELAMCARPGTYVVDLIGNGTSSRVVVQKGRLAAVVRIGAAGHVVAVLDEQGTPRPDARAWLGDREYMPDARGVFVVPFSTTGGTQPMLLACGDLATVQPITLVRESYALSAEVHLDRQSLVDGGTARALARVRLTVGGVPASLSLIEQPTWQVVLTDRHGIATTKQQPLKLSDDEAAVLEWALGEAPAQVAITLRGRVRVVSEQRDEDVSTSTAVTLATMHGTTATEALYLGRYAGGWVLHALGKTGEPRAQRPLSITLTHRWATSQSVVELATDARGRCELGQLPGVVEITATLAGVEQTWKLRDDAIGGGPVHAVVGQEVMIPVGPDRDAAIAVTRASLVEVRAGVALAHVGATLEPLAGAIVIRGLAAGEYDFRTPGCAQQRIRVASAGPLVEGHVIAGTEIVEQSRQAPVLGTASLDAEGLHVTVARASTRTRVHVIGTRFEPSPVARTSVEWPEPAYRLLRSRGAGYVSGRELGDEYRYVLDRRAAKRFPTLQLDKPSLLLNPWARRTTSTDVAVARPGGAFAPAPAPAMEAAYSSEGYGGGGSADDDAYLGYDFVATAPVTIANLVLDDAGSVRVPLGELGGAAVITVIVDDPAGTSLRRVTRAEPELVTKDLRLRLALDPERHATQQRAIAPLATGATLVVEDLATAKVHLLDSLERAHAYLLSLRDDATLREFGFVTRWHALPDSERRELYAKYACHELHLFLQRKDRTFFDAVVRPYLAHKRTKTFIDEYLLDHDLTPYLEPWRLQRLNAVERALLAQRLHTDPALARVLGDHVDIQPPDPARDSMLIDALLGASRLESSPLGELQKAAYDDAFESEESTGSGPPGAAGASFGAPMLRAAAAAPPAEAARPGSPKRKSAKKESAGPSFDLAADMLDRDVEYRRAEPPMFRAADKTQEWAENNWWHQTPASSTAELIGPNKLWRDLAHHRDGLFLSRWLGLATTSFAEAMAALAVIDLPFLPATHAMVVDGGRLTITAAGPTLAGSSQLLDDPLVSSGPPLVVGQTYVRADDRHQWIDGEQVDKYVDGSFLVGVVYVCQVVVANPTSTRQRIAVLVQVPRGSLPLGGARATVTVDVLLEAYGTHGHEYAFYFPLPGRYTHFPVHVSRAGVITAAAAPRTLDVTMTAEVSDPTSWSHVSQQGSLDEVIAYLATHNLAAIDLTRIAWRLKTREDYDRILTTLEGRRTYDATLWGYSLLHADGPRVRAWARALGERLLAAGPVLEMPVIDLDSEALAGYEHLEYAPLTNARAHRLGAKHRILNEGLAAQYQRFLELVAHRPAPTAEDLLAATTYLLAQDRPEEARATLARVEPGSIVDHMQYQYCVAYCACLGGDAAKARDIAERWRAMPGSERWRRKFEALATMLAELGGASAVVVDTKSREQQQAELAARQPAFDIVVDRDGVIVRVQHVSALELRFFVMDVELLFSRQPFVQSDVSRFSYIEPGHRLTLTSPGAETRIEWPASVRGKNVVVEAVGAGQRKAKIHYANDLAPNLAHQYGQVRVQRATNQSALPATYVKVYARRRDGTVTFYKDGYTDLRGWFDYATLSTNELDHVERFAILVCSDTSGAAILEASPPAR